MLEVEKFYGSVGHYSRYSPLGVKIPSVKNARAEKPVSWVKRMVMEGNIEVGAPMHRKGLWKAGRRRY